MRDTTSERQVEGPAIVMSEKGFAMFLEFMANIASGNNAKQQPQDVNFGREVDEFLKGRETYAPDHMEATQEAAPPPSVEKKRRRTKKDFKEEYEALRDIMKGSGPMQLKFIRAAMNDLGYWPTEPSRASTQIKKFMEMYPGEIVDCKRGVYHWPTSDEIVLTFKEPKNEQISIGDENNE